MRSRSLLTIVLIGCLGMGGLAGATKLAFDSDGELREIARFKVSLVESFAARGVGEASFRRSRALGCATLRLVADPRRVGASTSSEAEALDREIAEFVLAKFPRSRGTLKLEYMLPAGFGCRQPAPFRHSTLSFAEVSSRVEVRARRRAVEDDLAQALPGLRLVGLEQSGKELVGVFALEAPGGGRLFPPEEVEAVVEACAKAIRRHAWVPRTARIRVRLVRSETAGAAERAELLAEAEYDAALERRQLRLEEGP
jgi:hypothetical protein